MLEIIFGLFFIAPSLIASASMVSPAPSLASSVEDAVPVQALFCDQAEQLLQAVELEKHMTTQEALRIIDEESGVEGSCGSAVFIVALDEEQKIYGSFVADEVTFEIRKVWVWGEVVDQGVYAFYFEPFEQYAGYPTDPNWVPTEEPKPPPEPKCHNDCI